MSTVNVSVMNYLPRTDKQNMSRPCLNIVVGLVDPRFAELMDGAEEHAEGGAKLLIPSSFADRNSPQEVKRQCHTELLPFVEHERADWVDLDLEKGTATHAAGTSIHPYVRYVTKVLRAGSAPRESLPELDRMLPVGRRSLRHRGPQSFPTTGRRGSRAVFGDPQSDDKWADLGRMRGMR